MVGHQAVDHTNLSPGASQNLSKDFREVAENFLEYADTINLRKLDYNACDVYEQTFDEGSYHLEIQNVSATRSMEYTINENNEIVKQIVEPNNPKNYLTDQFIAAGGIRLVIYLIAKELGDSANPEVLNELLRLYLSHLTVSDERYPVDLSIRVLMRLLELPQFAMNNDLLENHGLITDGRFLYYFIQSYEIWSHRPQHFARVIHILRSVTQKERNRDLWNRGKLKILFPDLLQTILKLSQNPAFNENTLEEDSFGEDYAYLIKSLLQSIFLEKMSEEPLTLIWNTLFLLQPTSDTLFPMKSLNFLDLLGASAFDDIRASMVNHLVGTVGDSKEGSNVGDDGQSSLQNEEVRRKRNDLIPKNVQDSRSRSSVESWQKKILSDFVLNGPDEAVSSLLKEDLRTDCVLVMLTHQEDINLREAVVELLCNVLLRANKVQKMVFLNSRQYILLACEMRQQGVTLKMASCLFSIVFGESVDIRNGLDSTHVNGFTPDRLSCEILNVIYALLERSCMECPTTFAHICAALGKICEHNSQLQQAMMDRRLPEILTNVAIKISHLWQKQNEVSSETKFEQLREPFMRLTSGIILQAIPTGEKKIFENAKKFLHLLIAAERQVDEAEGKAANVFLRKLLCTLLVESIGLCQIFVDERGQYHRSASVASSVVGSDSDSSLEDSDCYVMVEVPHVNEEYFKPSPLTRNLSMFYNTLMQKASKKARSLDCPYKVKAVRTTNALEIAKHFAEIITLCHRAFSVMRAKDEVEEWENVFFSSYVEILVTAQAYTIARAPWYINALEEARSCFCKVFADTFFDSNRKETMGNGNYNILNEFYIERKRKLMNVRTRFPQNYLIPLLSQHLELNDLIRQGILEVLRHHPPESNFVQEVRDFAAWFGWTSLANGFLDGDSEQAFRSTLEMGLVGVVDEKRRILSRLQELVLNCHQSSLPTSDDEDLNDLLTKHVLIRQNAARKEAFDLSAKLSTKLGNIAEELQHCSSIVFHPRSPVFQSKHWPKTFVLSSVEGPQHERLRLIPGEVNIPKEHLQDCSLYDGEYSGGPLDKIIEHFNGNEEEIDIHKTSHSEIFYNIIFLKNGDEVSGTLIINDQEIVFLSYETKKRTMFKVVLSKITRIYKRRFVLEDVAVELLLKKKSYFFAFPNSENRDTVVDFIDEEKARNVNVEMEAKLLAESWRGGNISNFRFLGELNKLAGRTYDDLMQYPVMPFVIADYSSNHLDLTKSSSYRNLKIPISLQLPEMVNVYKELFSHYESIYKEALSHKDPKKKEQYVPHHYASLFSNPGIVTHLLVRLYPFSKHALVLQDGSFDLPDRLFSSVESTYRLVTQSKTDYKELLPEWLTTPEAFKNVLKLNLGKKQDGFVVDDVVVPPWANGCARKFIHAQRFALEQPQVTEKLNGWIDLSYPTNSESLPDDPVEGRARETMKRQYGQMPDQLFFSPLHMPFSKFKHPVHILGYLPEFRASGEDIMTTVDPCNAILPFPVSAFMNTIQGKLFGGLLRSMTNKDVSLHLYPTFDMEGSLDLSLVLMETIDKVQCFRISEKRKKIAICYENGVVDVLKISRKAQDGKKLSMASTEKRCTFYTQTPVVDLCFCLPFSFVVTAQEKGTVCVWDLNTRKFVVEKSLLPEGTSKAMVRVNQANGDIGIISPNFSTNETTISVCTVNLLFLETIQVAGIVVDAEVSNLDPGRGVACLVCLLQDQSIQIYEMLNLTRIFSYELPQDRKHIKIGFLDNGNIGLYSDCGVSIDFEPVAFPVSFDYFVKMLFYQLPFVIL
ncbi:unnamed protein product [Caenorhabditis auriculariae]|uniref:BEACH domain-containing protein n=1 Tax=Caenorhabditis auriculariae TaxID=2777116 RepID=A0A8S1H279_9PELO|nr:unnamed protein product [Caenorhabditis auriculariae]